MVVMAVAATGWWWTVHQGDAMASMALGLAQVGRAMPLSMGTAAFMGMWAAMIGAMMLPSIAPLVLGHPRARDPLAETSSRVAFLAGYLVLWVLVGVPALLALTGLSHLSHPGAWLDRAGGTSSSQPVPTSSRGRSGRASARTEPSSSPSRPTSADAGPSQRRRRGCARVSAVSVAAGRSWPSCSSWA